MKPFKPTPKRFHPKRTPILYEDHDIIVANKVHGLPTVSDSKSGDHTAFFLLNDYVRKGNPKSRKRIFIVHRLDRETSGVIVFAKSEQAKRYLQDNWADFKKTYHAVIHGKPKAPEGMIESYLAENTAHKMYTTDDTAKGKFAKTGYRLVRQSKKFSLLEINLMTGRKNQIRVHLADNEMPIVGDKRYGNPDKPGTRLALHATRLEIRHPHTHKVMTFEASMPKYFDTLVGKEETSDDSESSPAPD
jgi:tRNA pseudouridine32 synthase/23S rRNA pseudouridine746 synthase/23S rRNA pseudouridine1911/1915/1917 synthase